MIYLSWNCQGLESPQTIHHLKDLVKGSHPTVVFLMETKQGETHCEKVRRAVSMDFASYVQPPGTSGGLALWWTKEVAVTIHGQDKNFMDTTITGAGSVGGCRVTWVYGDSVFAIRSLN